MYQVLARKYRPRNFYELVGQQHVSKALTSALQRGRLHHAYLFTGTRGVGKTTIARILAKCLNCETGITATPCEQCYVCQAVNEGRFIDLIEIDAASRTKVEDTRELLDNVPYAPTQGRFKVYLIDEVHMLSTHSFNALLKTLEEPPSHVKFLFATTDPQKLPITVISRCLQFTLRPLSIEEIQQHLQKLLTLENIPYDEPALWQLAESAQGSLRDALSLTDQAIAYGQGEIYQHDVKEMLGLIDRHLVYDLLLAVHQNQRQRVTELLLLFRQQAIDVAMVLEQLISALHELALMQHLPDLTLSYSVEIQQKIHLLAHQISAPDIQLYYQICCKGREDLNLAITQVQGFEMCILRLLAFRPLNVNEYVAPSHNEFHEINHDIAEVSHIADIHHSSNVVHQQETPQARHDTLDTIDEYQDIDTIEDIHIKNMDIENNTIYDETLPISVDDVQIAHQSLNVSENVDSWFDDSSFDSNSFDAYSLNDSSLDEQLQSALVNQKTEIEQQEQDKVWLNLQSSKHIVFFADDDLIDVLQAQFNTVNAPTEQYTGYLYFVDYHLLDFSDDSSIPEQLLSPFVEKSFTESLATDTLAEHQVISNTESINDSTANKINSKKVVSQEPSLSPTEQRSPQEILAMPAQELSGEWTDAKWEFWLRYSQLSPAIQGILQDSIMQGTIGVEHHLFIQRRYAEILRQFEHEIQQHLIQSLNQACDLHYVLELPQHSFTPLMLEQQRTMLAHQQAKKWLKNTPSIIQLLQAFDGRIEHIELETVS